MTDPREEGRMPLARLVGWLFPGPLGEDVRRDLEREHGDRLRARGPWAAGLWLVGQLARPSSLALAHKLRSRPRGRPRSGKEPELRARAASISWLDVKLGARMLARYPLMTLVSGFAIAVSVAVAIGVFAFFQDFLLRPDVPLPGGERIVSLGVRTTDTNRTQRRILHEFVAWRENLTTVEDLGIWRPVARNIVGADGEGRLTPFAMMTATGFEVAGVPPLLGRPLLPADEAPGARPVVVIGYDAWQERFAGDPDILGRRLQIGRVEHEVVGVMPAGYGFPLSEQMWLPFTDDPDDHAPFEGLSYYAFGRLASGVDLEQAVAEVRALTASRAEAFPDTHGRVRGQVMPYTDTHTGMDDAPDSAILGVRVALGMLTLLLLIPFTNVAVLVYARTATRVGELAVRSALGASRRRIVAQLFAEALVLSTLSAVAGVALAVAVEGRVQRFLATAPGPGMPFWAEAGRNVWTVAYAVGLALMAAVVAGVVPGLRATGSRLQEQLKQSAPGSGLRLGRAWSSLIVVQVAVTVAAVPLVGWVAWQAVGMRSARVTFPSDGYVGATISLSPAERRSSDAGATEDARPPSVARVAARLEEVPGVDGVVLSTRDPSAVFSVAFSDLDRIEIEGVEPPPGMTVHRVGSMAVDAEYFGFLRVPVVQGREFSASDVDGDPPPILVNETFVRDVLGGANALGRSVRILHGPRAEPGPWRPIVGVVADLVENPLRPQVSSSWIYEPLARDRATAATLIARTRAPEGELASEIRRQAAAVDPALRIHRIAPLSDPRDPARAILRATTWGIAAVLLSLLLLCSAGVFALMSVNVTRRRREIGIRSALGARPERVVAAVLARSAGQLAMGVAAGLAVVLAVPPFSLDGLPIDRDPRLVLGVALVMVVVGLTAAVGPARRGLAIPPTEALREE